MNFLIEKQFFGICVLGVLHVHNINQRKIINKRNKRNQYFESILQALAHCFNIILNEFLLLHTGNYKTFIFVWLMKLILERKRTEERKRKYFVIGDNSDKF